MRYWWYVRGLVIGVIAGIGVTRFDGGDWVTVVAFILVVATATVGTAWALADDKKASPASRTPPS